VLLLSLCGASSYLLVISNVVPKIWARTNSAMAMDCREGFAAGAGGSDRGGGRVVVVMVEVVELWVDGFATGSRIGAVF
jgi:hypothetical protein